MGAENQEPHGGARAPDDYEARYMPGEGVLYRDKIQVPKKFFLIFALPVLFQAITFAMTAFSGKPLPLAVFAILPLTILFSTLLALLFAVLRITVTRREVHVQYGLFGPKIPVASIQDCKAVEYRWMDYGGWGIRRGRDGSWAYNMVGDAGRAVRIEWLDAKGKRNVTLVASPDPEALARAIQQARGVPGARIAAGAAAGLRVAEPRDEEFEADADSEAAAEAEGPADLPRRRGLQ